MIVAGVRRCNDRRTALGGRASQETPALISPRGLVLCGLSGLTAHKRHLETCGRLLHELEGLCCGGTGAVVEARHHQTLAQIGLPGRQVQQHHGIQSTRNREQNAVGGAHKRLDCMPRELGITV